MTTSVNESHVEAAAIEWFQDLGYAFVHGPEIAPGEPAAERDSLLPTWCSWGGYATPSSV